MAKALDSERTRLVMTGPDSGPTKMWAEYGVVDGDMQDLGKKNVFEGTNFDTASNTLWTSTMSALETAEGIT